LNLKETQFSPRMDLGTPIPFFLSFSFFINGDQSLFIFYFAWSVCYLFPLCLFRVRFFLTFFLEDIFFYGFFEFRDKDREIEVFFSNSFDDFELILFLSMFSENNRCWWFTVNFNGLSRSSGFTFAKMINWLKLERFVRSMVDHL
jgi:hypothetical protein